MARVQSNQLTQDSATPAIAYDTNLSAGHMSVVGVRLSSTVTINSVVGSLNGGYTLLAGPVDFSTNIRAALYGFANSAAGAETITFNLSAVETARMFCAAYSGRALSFGTPNTNNSGFIGPQTGVSSGSISIAAGSDLFGFLAINGPTTTFDATGSLIEITETDGDRFGAASVDNPGAGSYAYTGNLSAAETHCAFILELLAAGGGGGPQLMGQASW